MARRNPKGFGIALFCVAVVMILTAVVGVLEKTGWLDGRRKHFLAMSPLPCMRQAPCKMDA